MCLNIFNNPFPYIADEDIPCYKILTGKRISPTFYFKFNYNEVYKTDIKRHKDDFISQAFHSFSTYDEAVRRIDGYYGREEFKIYEAIIPKGSTYFYNEHSNEFASSSFMLKRQINFLDKIKIFFTYKTMPFIVPLREHAITESLNNVIIIE